ncbi:MULTISPECIES: hypothetical protein [unclassified Shewanella]|uniref:hypothetical protein n=1 Tax=unclassified Shewanella TaxID=196818 RepID=UPI0021D89FED|nr:MULTISPECIES: hypothetical protein [unclassified Shewanella]MCU8034371.1 hypothetical protein [Shewanella sp. SM71]MCU8096078.1 hypothetical protein [Shewanella sp. SM102]
MIQAIIDRLKTVEGATVREGFYAQGVAKDKQFIFLQPFTDDFKAINGINSYRDDLVLQVVAGITVDKTPTPTADLINLVRAIRSAFYKDERNVEKLSWLPSVISFKELEPCKYIMPEAHEKHGLAVITLSLVNTVKFGDSL